LHLRLDEAGLAQHLEVMRDRRRADVVPAAVRSVTVERNELAEAA
jgi:hypothetical protein